MPGYHDAMPIMLLDAGYDVWIDGHRGSKYQRDHQDASISPEKYWDFSFYDEGRIDQPAQIEYILQTTG